MVGGRLGSYIGKFHRWGAMLDDSAELVCGCFSRSMDRNRATAEAYHLPDTSRVYADFREMADKESAREDGIDFVSIMTANDTHYEIAKCFLEHDIHVICDKPLALRTEEAEELARIAEERGLLFSITYSYTGYALIRQAREMICAGAIGDILHVRVQHPEDWVISSAVDGKVDTSAWRFQPEKVGSSLCTNNLGTHAEQMAQFTGLHVKHVLAMMDTYPRDLPLDTNVNVLMDFGGGVTGTLWASQIAIGHECDSGIYVIGTGRSRIYTVRSVMCSPTARQVVRTRPTPFRLWRKACSAFALSRPVCAAIRPEASGWTYKAAPSLFDGSPPVLKVQRDFLM